MSEHKHEFSVDAACDGCDVMLSQLVVGQQRRIAALAAALAEAKAWIDDLQSGMYVNCVYCGHRYGPGETTPVTMADALKAHVEQCPRHPMSVLREALAERTRERDELEKSANWLALERQELLLERTEDRAAIRAQHECLLLLKARNNHGIVLTWLNEQLDEINTRLAKHAAAIQRATDERPGQSH